MSAATTTTAAANVYELPAKLPPQALEAEQSLLGGLLLDNRAWDNVADEVRADDFYHQNHKLIFEAVQGLQSANDPADIVTASEWLKKQGNLDKAGGLAYLGTLANNTPGTANILTYARIVREMAILRELIAAANDITRTAYDLQGKSPREVLDYAQQRVVEISEGDDAGRSGFTELKALLSPAIDRIEELAESKESITGIATGFKDLDAMTSGLQRGDLVIVAGRPSTGKTSFALNIAEYAAVKNNLTVAVFSMEMPGVQIALRMLSSIGSIDAGKLRTGQLNRREWQFVNTNSRMLGEARMFVDDSSMLTPLQLRARARRLWRKNDHNLDLIVVDYLQLMNSAERNENRATEIAAITRALKSLAKELNVPVVALSQLNRALEQRPNKRPMMSDLRESGAIEQDADVIFFLYREEAQSRDEVRDEPAEDSGQPSVVEVIIGKQRNGPVGTRRLSFLGRYTRFEDYAEDHAYPPAARSAGSPPPFDPLDEPYPE